MTVKTDTIELSPFGYPMELEYEWDKGELPILFPLDESHPGSPAGAVLIEARVGGHNIINELSFSHITFIEAAINKAKEG